MDTFFRTDFSKLPNDIIMDIIRLADGGINRHKKKLGESLNIINEARDVADQYIQYHVDEDEGICHDWDRGDPVLIADSPGSHGYSGRGTYRYSYNWHEWNYAFFDIIEDYQMKFTIRNGQRIYTW